jgi:hypothetical protein
MTDLTLTNAERIAFSAIRDGVRAKFETNAKERTIRAAVVRHIVLGLPVVEEGQGILLKAASLFGLSSKPETCRVTGAGISIEGALITGLLDLDAAIGEVCGCLPSLAFVGCRFEDGFSAKNAHFSRLSFADCDFANRGRLLDPRTGKSRPIIDISGATLDHQLELTGIAPTSDEDLLWIRAAGLRVDGGVELSGCTLRAPVLVRPDGTKTAEDALDLTLAEIGGDLSFDEGSRAVGGLKARGIRVRGDFWLNGAKIDDPASQGEALFLQGARIEGFLSMRPLDGVPDGNFRCRGRIDLTAAEVGKSLVIVDADIEGGIKAPDMAVEDDFFLHARVAGRVDLGHVRIGGVFDISKLAIEAPTAPLVTGPGHSTARRKEAELSLRGGTIGQALRLSPEDSSEPCEFKLDGEADLTGLSCGTLDDEIGQCWGGKATLRMNHFTYRQTAGLPRRSGKPSHRIVGDWVLAKRADGRWPWSWFPDTQRLHDQDFWQTWQLRRNWIYQQYGKPADAPVSISRYQIDDQEYRPQPFEQVIRVARAEGREDFAIHFEMLKKRIEWRLFNDQVRWLLAFAGIILASAWLMLDHGDIVGSSTRFGVIPALLVTLWAMLRATTIHHFVCWLFKLEPGRASFVLTWGAFFVPALSLLLVSEWRDKPFHFLVALLIFLSIRFSSVLVHAMMRFGFGYMRRPVLAFVTLIGAFLLGWWGVHVANGRDMLVINARPVAAVAGRHGSDHGVALPQDKGAGHSPANQSSPPLLMGSEVMTGARPFDREFSCAPEISEPLYALDILIPIVDLGEESRCEVRRIGEPDREIINPERLGIYGMAARFPDLPLNDHRFWWWLKAAYSILGWFLFSLAILTFAQVNRTHAEPPGEE